jgi:hypothetical protein
MEMLIFEGFVAIELVMEICFKCLYSETPPHLRQVGDDGIPSHRR